MLLFLRIFKTFVFLLLFFIFLVNAQSFKEEALKHYENGNLYYQKGLYKEAEREYQKAKELLEKEKLITKERSDKKISSPDKEKSSLEYVVGEDDVLYILVWQNPDLTMEVIVRPDGKISFPLIGDIEVKGFTLSEIKEKITEQLKEYIVFPQVSISLKKLGGKKVIVLGEVNRPGVYAVSGARTILEAIGLAGGFNSNAVITSTVLIRGGFQKPKAMRVNLARALKEDLKENVSLEAEDIIFVPKKFIADLNYFLNQILEPLSKGTYINKEIQAW